jgi:tRNA threonylcarbamoyladenosine biosynthesis protein TsaB
MEVAETETGMLNGKLLLGVDTCGPVGSVALGRLAGGRVEILGQIELEGRSYSARLVAAIGELLVAADTQLSLLHAMVAVNGPGSFTGVRVGLSAVKGLAEPGRIPVVAVSRLEVLACKAGCAAAALDAHRQEVFLRVGARELLAGAEGLAGFDSGRIAERGNVHEGQSRFQLSVPSGAEARVLSAGPDVRAQARTLQTPIFSLAVCDDAAAALLAAAWPDVRLVKVEAPTAADALRLCAGRVEAGNFADLALLDGHYLRRSDAEIFGDATKAKSGAVEGA